MKKTWWRSLRTKIIGWSFVPTVIILSAVAWFTFYSYQRVIGDLAIKQYPEIIQPKAIAFSQTFNGIFNPILIPVLMEIDRDHELPIEARAQNILDHAQDLDIFDGGIYFLDQQGKVIKTQPPQPDLIGQDWSDTPHFRSVNAAPNFGADTDLINIGSSGKKILCVAMAMTGQAWDEVLGAIYYCFTIYPASQNVFYQKMAALDLGSNLYVVDRNHQVLYSPDPSEMGKDLSGEAYIRELSQGENSSGRYRIGTEDMVVGYIPVFPGVQTDRASWYMFAEKSWAEIMQPTLPYQRLLSGLLALGVIVPALVTSYGVRHITGPIQKLIRATEQVSEGQFKQRIEVQTGDEIETLADRFNVMAARLDDSYASLEKKVADRTRELAIVNAIVSVASQSLDIQEILKRALKETVEQMGFEAGAAFRLSAVSAETQMAAQQGFEAASAHDLARCCAIASQACSTEDAPQVITYALDKHPGDEQALQLAQAGYNWLVSVPLATKGRTLGLFLLGRREPGELSPEELSLLSSIGQQIGVAIENAHLYEQAEQAATAAERHRLARELHDAVTQTLFSANLIADVIPRIWKRNPDEGMQSLEELRQLTRGALAEMRTMLLEMRPESLERADLNSLLTQLADAFVGRVRVPVSLDIQGGCALTHEVKLVFYRVAQETLNNIAKHSGARQVDVYLECQSDHMLLKIRDDGLGFDPAAITPDHLGIAIMRERANSIGANLRIDSLIGIGTSVELDWKSTRKDEAHE
jgi:nitrate/nitrite-specific signal transduction histidine kinase